MEVNRKQRRLINRNSEDGKRIHNLPFMHPDKVENRKANKERGNQQHETFTMMIQEKIGERLGVKESELIENLKSKDISKPERDSYLEIWSSVNLWPKPKNYQVLRKELKKLNKEYNING